MAPNSKCEKPGYVSAYQKSAQTKGGLGNISPVKTDQGDSIKSYDQRKGDEIHGD